MSHTMAFKASHRIRLPTSELRPGMYVAELDRPWENTPFLFQGFVLQSEEDVEAVRQCCEHVVIDQLKYVRIGHRTPRRGAQRHRPATDPQRALERSLPKARKVFEGSNRLVRDIMDDVRLGKAVDTPAAKEAVASCVDNILENPDAMTLLTRIRQKDEYTSEHSLSVAILSISLGRTLGMERQQLNELGMCGLLHDIGKVMTPDHILKKPERLTVEEMEVMKEHPVSGRDILLSTDGVAPAALDVAHGHHERLNGTGYPRGLNADQLSLYTKVVAVTDTFDAITSDRAYDAGRTHVDAFKILSKGSGRQWDTKLVLDFIRTVGIYPPGTLVELSTGDYGVVIASNPGEQLRPLVALLPHPGEPANQVRRIDLARTRSDEAGQPLRIVQVRNPRQLGVDLHALKADGLLDGLARPAD